MECIAIHLHRLRVSVRAIALPFLHYTIIIYQNCIEQEGTRMIRDLIKEGQAAPAFSTADQGDALISLADFAGSKNVVLYF